jgi:hypothetical protein
LLSRFILATTSDSGKVDYKYLRDIIMNIGKDTTAGGLSWFMYMMCKKLLNEHGVFQLESPFKFTAFQVTTSWMEMLVVIGTE